MAEFVPAMVVLMGQEVENYQKPNQRSWSNDPHDNGRETNFGISTLIIQRHNITLKDLGVPGPLFVDGYLKDMTEISAWTCWKKYFWTPRPELAEINSQLVCDKLWLMLANASDPRMFALTAQRALCGMGCSVAVDGIMGPKTVDALNSQSESEMLDALCSAHRAFYQSCLDAGRKTFEADGDVRHLQDRVAAGWFKRAAWRG